MAQNFYKGIDTSVIFAEDTAWGTPGVPTGSSYIDEVNSFTANITNNLNRIQAIGKGRNASSIVNGGLDVNGNITWFLTDPSFLQYCFFGAESGAGSAADPYEVQESNYLDYSTGVKSLTFEVGSEGGANDSVMTYDGCVINTFTLNANVGEVINCSADWIGRNGTSSTAIETYTGPTNRPFTFVDGGVTIAGTTVGELTIFSLTCNNNFQTFRTLGNRLLSQPVAGVRRYDFSFTMKLQKDSASVIDGLEARSYVFDGTDSSTTPNTGAQNTAIALSLDLVEGAAGGDRVVNFDFENVYFESIGTPVAIGEADAGVVEITIIGYALSGLTDGAVKVPVRWWTIA